MIPVEQEYFELVGEEGYKKAQLTLALFNLSGNDETTTKLYYLILTNAYYRGVNAGVERSRDILRAQKAVASGERTH